MRLRSRLRVSAEHDGRRLDEVLAAWLPVAVGRALSRASVRRLIMAGAVSVDGRVLRRPGRPLAEGQEIAATIDRRRLPAADVVHARPTEISERDILWEDEWLIAVAKPAGLAFHPTADSARPSLTAAVKRLVGRRAGPRTEPYLGVHQRLDVGTSGVALFVLRREANAGLARAFSDGRVAKTYHALTVGARESRGQTWQIDLGLAPQGTGRRARMAPARDGLRARTDVRILRVLSAALLIEARPLSGRKHQIRAHLASQRLPLLGDTSYGGPARLGALRFARPMLHALRLDLPHPVTGIDLAIECPYAEDFRAALAQLRR